MSRRRKNNRTTGAPVLHCLNPHAAGVDVGATEIYIAVPVDRDPRPVRRFSTFTEDLRAAAAWSDAVHPRPGGGLERRLARGLAAAIPEPNNS